MITRITLITQGRILRILFSMESPDPDLPLYHSLVRSGYLLTFLSRLFRLIELFGLLGLLGLLGGLGVLFYACPLRVIRVIRDYFIHMYHRSTWIYIRRALITGITLNNPDSPHITLINLIILQEDAWAWSYLSILHMWSLKGSTLVDNPNISNSLYTLNKPYCIYDRPKNQSW